MLIFFFLKPNHLNHYKPILLNLWNGGGQDEFKNQLLASFEEDKKKSNWNFWFPFYI